MNEKIIQTDIFGKKIKEKEVNKIEDHWINMPEYNNVNRKKPVIIAIFKFKNKEDFKKFNKLVREHIYNGKQIHYGRFKENVRVTWYPKLEQASKYVYKDEDDLIDEAIDFDE